ncbi:MAG: inorganic phosphate transporter [Sarcina sp.]
MHSALILIIIIVILALIFDFTNGFHDTATVVATTITTRALSPTKAILICAIFNFIGAFTSTAVAKTVGNGIVDSSKMPLWIIVCVLFSAILWNLLTWYFGVPTSSTCALIGSLVGGGIAIANSFKDVGWGVLFSKFIIWIFISPVIGFILGYIILGILKQIFQNSKPRKTNKFFQKAQIISGALISLNHGANDSQKSMGIITMSLVSAGFISSFAVPIWVVLLCATAMGLGTSVGGKRIIKTIGNKVTKIEPIGGFVSQISAAMVLAIATNLHAPVSTTQVMTSAIMGTGSQKSFKRVNWNVAKDIVLSWIITIPSAAILCYIIAEIVRFFIFII